MQFFRGRKTDKEFKKNKRTYKGRPSRKLDEALRGAGINPEIFNCQTCGEDYNINNQAAWELHAHSD